MQDVKEKVKQDYIKGMKQKEISAKYDISLNTLKSWIKRYNWASEKKKGAPKNKRGAPIGNEIKDKDKFDILWEQITIQYAAIIRAQKIMYVKDKEEMIKELKKHESTENGEKIEYEFQFAWDRQASFLNAQSRAMSELRSLIKQYDEMIHKDWNLATEEQRARVEVLKSKINNQESKEDKLDRYFDKLESVIKND